MAKEKYEKNRAARALANKRKTKARNSWQPYVKYDDEITTSTWVGLVVSIKNALSLVTYLDKSCNYLYLMTRRINQDSLEVTDLKLKKIK